MGQVDPFLKLPSRAVLCVPKTNALSWRTYACALGTDPTFLV